MDQPEKTAVRIAGVLRRFVSFDKGTREEVLKRLGELHAELEKPKPSPEPAPPTPPPTPTPPAP